MRRTIQFSLRCMACVFLAAPVQAQVQLEWEEILQTGALSIGLNPLDHDIIYAQQDGFFKVSYDGGDTWQQRGAILPFEDRNIAVCPADTSVIIMYSAGSLLRSDDGGWSWNVVLSNVSMDGETIEYHPTNPDTVYYADFATGNFWVSSNKGLTWSIRANMDADRVCAMAVNPFNPQIIVAGGANTRIVRTTDGGFNWQEVKSGRDYFSEIPKLTWSRTDPNVAYGSAYCDGTYSVFKSTDAGATWTAPGMYGTFTWGLDIDPNTDEAYLGSFHGNIGRGIYKSYDHGSSWQLLGDIPFGFTWMIKAGNNKRVYVLSLGQTFGVGGLFRMDIDMSQLGFITGVISDSVNGNPIELGKITVDETGDWVSLGNADGTFKMALLPGTYTLRVLVGQIEKTVSGVTVTAGGTTNLDIDIPIVVNYLPISGIMHNAEGEPLPGIATLYAAKNGTIPITFVDTVDASGSFGFDSLSTLNSYDSLVVTPSIKPYLPGTVKPLELPSEIDVELDLAEVLLIDDTDPSDFHTRRYKIGLTRLGVTWANWVTSLEGKSVPSGIVGQTKKKTAIWWTRSTHGFIAQAVLDSLEKMCEEGYNIFLSGQNIVEQNFPATLFKDKLGVGYNGNYLTDDFISGAIGSPVGAGFNFQISQNTQNSRDILTVTNPTAAAAFYYGQASTSNIAAVTVDNTGNGGKAVVLGFELSYSTPFFDIFIPILGRVINYLDTSTVIDDGEGDTPVPQTIELAQNYPNPFNPRTTIKYSLSIPGDVKLTVFNLAGQQVKTLVSAKQPAGDYAVQWDGANDANQQVASGVYLYRLTVGSPEEAGGFVQTRKMILLR